jgi:hypothetical protein
MEATMKTIDFMETAGDDGVLRLQVPVEGPGERYHVILHLEAEGSMADEAKHGWPPGFFEETAGQWEGNFPDESEGEYEERLSF